MPKTIAILGGGVAGLSAAHELAEHGFRFFPSFYRHLTDTKITAIQNLADAAFYAILTAARKTTLDSRGGFD